jgi:hypothetical protein
MSGVGRPRLTAPDASCYGIEVTRLFGPRVRYTIGAPTRAEALERAREIAGGTVESMTARRLHLASAHLPGGPLSGVRATTEYLANRRAATIAAELEGRRA